MTHEQLQRFFPFNFFDIKYLAEAFFNFSNASLDMLLSKFYDVSDLKQHNDASFDTLLTAIVYEKLKAVFGEDIDTKARFLFKYAKQE